MGVALTGSDGGSGLSRMRISDSGVLSHGVLRSGLEMPWARTVPGWLLTDRRWGGHSGDGVHHVYAQLQDAAGNWSRVIRDSIVLDATAPVVSPPDVRFVPGSQIARSGPPVPLRATFSATDATSGVAATDLQRRTGGGPWSAVDTGSAVGTSATLLLADDPSTTQQLRARARDAAGSWSPEHPGGTFTIEPLQEDASAWSYASAWHVAVDASAYGGATRWANTAGALATLEFTGTDVALIAVRGPDRGVASVSIDGTLVQTLDLGASHSLPRDIVFAAHVAAGPHVLQVRVSGSNGPASTGNRVDIDAAVVLAQ